MYTCIYVCDQILFTALVKTSINKISKTAHHHEIYILLMGEENKKEISLIMQYASKDRGISLQGGVLVC